MNLGEIFAASGMNWMNTFYGRALGHCGGKPGVITKLFSAAKEWGPAEDGWQRFDNTWLCVDSKGIFGRTVEQGRVIWHFYGEGASQPRSVERPPKQATKLRVRSLCGSRRAVMCLLVAAWILWNAQAAATRLCFLQPQSSFVETMHAVHAVPAEAMRGTFGIQFTTLR